jgi:hypothetical protein
MVFDARRANGKSYADALAEAASDTGVGQKSIERALTRRRKIWLRVWGTADPAEVQRLASAQTEFSSNGQGTNCLG